MGARTLQRDTLRPWPDGQPKKAPGLPSRSPGALIQMFAVLRASFRFGRIVGGANGALRAHFHLDLARVTLAVLVVLAVRRRARSNRGRGLCALFLWIGHVGLPSLGSSRNRCVPSSLGRSETQDKGRPGIVQVRDSHRLANHSQRFGMKIELILIRSIPACRTGWRSG